MNVHDVVQDMHAMCIEDDMYGSFMDVQGGSFTAQFVFRHGVVSPNVVAPKTFRALSIR